MRKSLSIFFAAVLVCMVHTGSWALWGSVPSGCSQYIDVCSNNDCGMTSSGFGNTTGCATYTAYKVRNVSYEPAPFIVYDCTSCQSGYTWKDPQQELTALNQYLSGLGNSSCQSVPAFGQCKESQQEEPAQKPNCKTLTPTELASYNIDIQENANPVDFYGNHPTGGGNCGTTKYWSVNIDTTVSSQGNMWLIEECTSCDFGEQLLYEDGQIDIANKCYFPYIKCHQCTERSHCPDDTDWTGVSGNNLVQTRTTYICSSSYSCVSIVEYQCVAGYHNAGTTTGPNMNCVANACSGDGDCDDGLHCNTATGACISGCVTDVHCSGNTPVCNTSNNTCVQCTGDDHCPDSGWVSNDNNRQSYTTNVCSNNSCTASGTTYQCINGYVPKDSEHTSDSSLVCVQCTENGHCPDGAPVCSNYTCVGGCTSDEHCSGSTPICDTATNACVGCINSDDCYGNTPICNTSEHQCVECLEATDCGTDSKVFYSCTNNQCDCKCNKDHYLHSGSGCEITCNPCPPKDYIIQPRSIPGETDGPNTNGMDACYISYGGTIEDDTGWFTINGNCGWDEE